MAVGVPPTLIVIGRLLRTAASYFGAVAPASERLVRFLGRIQGFGVKLGSFSHPGISATEASSSWAIIYAGPQTILLLHPVVRPAGLYHSRGSMRDGQGRDFSYCPDFQAQGGINMPTSILRSDRGAASSSGQGSIPAARPPPDRHRIRAAVGDMRRTATVPRRRRGAGGCHRPARCSLLSIAFPDKDAPRFRNVIAGWMSQSMTFSL